ncbi:MAG: class I SAM-dependent methyltransferase [Alphaproteobacteria bacterium]|nr:class I SAM-dependent methyltransferase [Alphaproteobacteria bacterium]
MDRRAWSAYYTAKRIGQQWLQVELLNRLPVERVLEIGPHLGLVTAMLDNAGYDVTTLDRAPRAFDRPAGPHIEADLLGLRPEQVRGFDAILCSEVLEHLPWEAVPGVLRVLRASGAPILVVAVPYEAFQVLVSLTLNRHRVRQAVQFKKLRFLRRFPTEGGNHRWEVGYRGHGLGAWERLLRQAGWTIARREFTHPCRTVVHVLRAEDRGKGSG